MGCLMSSIDCVNCRYVDNCDIRPNSWYLCFEHVDSKDTAIAFLDDWELCYDESDFYYLKGYIYNDPNSQSVSGSLIVTGALLPGAAVVEGSDIKAMDRSYRLGLKVK